MNVFVPPAACQDVFSALLGEIKWDAADAAAVGRDEQVRLWWDDTPVDPSFAGHEMHRKAGRRTRQVEFTSMQIPVLGPVDLATFKVLFDRTMDGVDIETMPASGTSTRTS